MSRDIRRESRDIGAGGWPEAWLREFRRLPRPLSISFSGGRTSGLMLRLMLDAHGGRLPDDTVVLFANTGKEHPATLDFVQECSARWDVPIIWLEWDEGGTDAQEVRVVSHNSASRDGEPFERLIGKRNMLPNPVTRFCTIELKIRPMARYCRDALGWRRWNVALGFRADEPARVARLRNCGRDGLWQAAFDEEFLGGKAHPDRRRTIPGRRTGRPRGERDGFKRHAPLAAAGVTRHDVAAFWRGSDFDLRLPMTPDGKTPHGNCVGCFLKAEPTLRGIFRDDPAAAEWWIEQERRPIGAKSPAAHRFRSDRRTYAEMVEFLARQGDLVDPPEGWNLEGTDCACTD